MKNTLITLALLISVTSSSLPVMVFADEFGNTYDYNYTTPVVGNTYDYNYVTPTVGNTYDYNYTTPVVGNTYDYNYTTGAQITGNTYDYNYTSSVIGNTYDYNYATPVIGNTYDYNYTTPVVGNTYDYNYVTPTVGNTYDYNYTTPVVGNTYDYNYTTGVSGTGYSNTFTPITTSSFGYGTTFGGYYGGSTYAAPVVVWGGNTGVNTVIGGTQVPTCNGGNLYNNICYVCNSNQTWSGTSCVNNVAQCPTNSTRVNGTCQCNSGFNLINNVCQAIAPTPTPTCQYVADPYVSSYHYNYPNCTKVCSNGNATVNGNTMCPAPVTPTPVPVPQPYPVPYPVPQPYPVYPTVNYQTCWNGVTMPLTSVCPQQYKVCANGTSVPVNQTCYRVCANGTIVSEGSYCQGTITVPTPVITTVKFNNVVTSPVTEITNISGRCNGIGLIANGAQSTGWFEYGETANLGRATAKAAIGSSVSAPFSNLLTNLKPGTTYYCRAMMSNSYGEVRGEIVRFTTKQKAAVYVKPVTTPKTPVKKPVVTKKPEIICSDGSIITLNSQSSATLINNGQKLATLQMEKTSGELAVGQTVSYRLAYKNLSDTTLTNVAVKITIPAEIDLTNVSAGGYDVTSRTLTLQVGNLGAYAEGNVSWTGKVVANAQVGKSIVTTGYLVYTVEAANGADVQDEVTAYVVGSILPAAETPSTGAKHVIGAEGDRGFLPDSLIEWLALIAILFIIFILGRSIASSYHKEEQHH